MDDYKSLPSLAPAGVSPLTASAVPIDTATAEAERLHQCADIEAFGRLMIGVVHDLNNLLQVIHGHAQLAVDAIQVGTPERKRLSAVMLAAEDAAAVTRMLLSARHGLTPQCGPVNLAALLEEHCRLINRLMGRRIQVQLATSHPDLWVSGDDAMLRRVLLNLTLNARDAMPQGGVLRLGLDAADPNPDACQATAFQPWGTHARLTVTDTGTGMTPDVLQRLFTPFFSTKGPVRGTGLGLYMVQDIVTRHGGTVDVHSVPGQGTTFRIYLPLRDAPSAPA